MFQFLEAAASVIEMLAVAVILAAIVHAGVIVAIQCVRREDTSPYEICKRKIGRGLLLGLELLIAGDIIKTVAVNPSMESMTILGLLVLIRTFLSWSVSVEIDGHWPWHGGKTDQDKR